VHHDADGLVAAQDHGAVAGFLRHVEADQMLFHQHALLQIGQIRHGNPFCVAEDGIVPPLAKNLLHPLEHFLGLILVGNGGKGKVGQVARNPDPAADDDVGLGTFSPHPFADGISYITMGHAHHPPWYSSFPCSSRIRSRRRAASSNSSAWTRRESSSLSRSISRWIFSLPPVRSGTFPRWEVCPWTRRNKGSSRSLKVR